MADEGLETRRGFRVSGRVQGVGFRWWTQRTARGLGLGGSVRNLPDGSVEVIAVGPPEKVSRLEAALHSGPLAARVDRVEEVRASPVASSGDFVITT